MPPLPKKQGYGSESEFQSSHLWVGNLPFDIAESELMALFEKYGVIDGITCYASRSYAFVYYKRVEDAVVAKESLQGFTLNGNSIKIEFAKPAKPSKHVWIGGFSSAVTREELEEELSKFGKTEEFKFLRDRNTALVEFVKIEDASAAVKAMNGMQIGDDYIRVDFLRSLPARRDQTDFNEMGSAQFRGVGGFESTWINPDIIRNYSESTYSGQKRPQPSLPVGGRKGDNPSKVLWVGYPPGTVVDEDILHNAMILHGEIERIKCYHGRNYSFVEFRSIEEARRAKEALQGRLFNDPRVVIMFSNSKLAPGNDPNFSGFRGQRPEVFGNKGPFVPPPMDMYPPMAMNSFSVFNGRLGHDMLRPFGPRGNLDPLLPTPDFYDPSMHSISDLPGGMNQRKLSPSGAGLLPSPVRPGRSSNKTSGWDVVDPILPTREPKRSRTDAQDEYADQPYGSVPPFGGGALARGHAKSGSSLRGSGVDDYVWRGVIAKGSNPVCHARCIPMGKKMEFKLPEVINCSARTGLDMLAKHYAGAFGFDIVFFLPDSEDDFANYTEFLRYLGSKNRAGVAKLDDENTLFLVPPSDFLTDVLKVTGRERLYGVVLKLQPSTPPAIAPPSQQFNQQQIERPLAPPTHDYHVPNPDFHVHTDNGTGGPPAAIPPKTFPTSSGPAVSLPPELIASLQSIQAAAQSSINSTTSNSWNQQSQVHEQQSQQHGGMQQPYQPLTNNFQSFSTNQNFNGHPTPPLPETMPTQNHIYNPPDQSASRPSQQPYPGEGLHYVQQGYSMMHAPTPTGSFGAKTANGQQPYNPGSYPSQFHGNSSHLEMNKSEPVNSVERFQPAPGGSSGAGQGTSEAEVDKNQRYQTTLQFAANLLLQIQQQQQQQQQQQKGGGGSNMGNQQ